MQGQRCQLPAVPRVFGFNSKSLRKHEENYVFNFSKRSYFWLKGVAIEKAVCQALEAFEVLGLLLSCRARACEDHLGIPILP